MKYQTVCLHLNIYIELNHQIFWKSHYMQQISVCLRSMYIGIIASDVVYTTNKRSIPVTMTSDVVKYLHQSKRGAIHGIKEIFWCCFWNPGTILITEVAVACIRTRFKGLLGLRLIRSVWPSTCAGNVTSGGGKHPTSGSGMIATSQHDQDQDNQASA